MVAQLPGHPSSWATSRSLSTHFSLSHDYEREGLILPTPPPALLHYHYADSRTAAAARHLSLSTENIQVTNTQTEAPTMSLSVDESAYQIQPLTTGLRWQLQTSWFIRLQATCNG